MSNAENTFAVRRIRCGTASGRIMESANLRTSEDTTRDRAIRVWSAGDYDRIAAGFRDGASAFVERQRLEGAHHVLDAACGSGNVTIPAARTGATVVGLDIVWSLMEQAAAWGEREGLSMVFDEGSVEEMPYDDAEFDVVLSMFGLMFAARPERVASELARVTRRGGKVALANWTRDGFVGQMLALHVAHAPPASAPSPLLWGDETVVHERLDPRDWDVTTSKQVLTFRYPQSPAGTAALFGSAYGPTVRVLESLDPRRRAQFMEQFTALWAAAQRRSDSETEVQSEYLEVVAVRR